MPDLDSTTRVPQLGVLGCTRIYSTTWVISRVSQCAGNVGHIAAAPVLKMMVPWMLVIMKTLTIFTRGGLWMLTTIDMRMIKAALVFMAMGQI